VAAERPTISWTPLAFEPLRVRVALALRLERAGKSIWPWPRPRRRRGMHKFDASEVDVHGGTGAADDVMDAFGF